MSDKKRLFENFISLTILQGANYILPLITFPYLVRILGPEKFGLISFSQAFIQYFILITDYGFNLTATRQISINRNDKKKISQILSSVLTIKLFFMILSLLLLYVTVSLFDKFKYHSYIYFYTFGIVIGNVLFPVWFFQGLEKMKYITVLNISTRLISMLCIFIFIREVSDFKYVPIINSVASILIGCVSIFIVFSKFKVCYSIPSLKMIKEQLIEGWYVFISSIATSLYTISNTFILGLFTNNVIVGYYASGEKLVKAVQGLIQPVSQTIYPYINNLAQQSKERALTFISKIFCGIGIVTFATSLFLFYFSHILVNLVLGTKYEESIIIVKILSFLPFIVGLSNILGIQTMLTFNYKKAFSTILILSSLFNILSAFILVPTFKHIGTATSVLITETIVSMSMLLYLNRKGIRFFGGKQKDV